MGSDASKTAEELADFQRFIEAEQYPIDLASIKKPDGESKPDFYCKTLAGEELALEVTELCAQELAQMIALAGKQPDAFVWTSDPTERIVGGKLQKCYDTDLPLELLCCWKGRTVSTDDMIISTIGMVVNSSSRNPFRRIWYHGEEGVYLVHGVR